MVHLLLTGATGFCGREVLRFALLSPIITSILVITRRPLPDELGSRKLRTIVHSDFTNYPSSLVAQITAFSPDACIWCIGGSRSNFSTQAEFELVSHTYTLAAARMLSEIAAASEKRFRFVYLSGWGADITESKWRPFDKDTMYVKGRVESDLFALTRKHPQPEKFELYTFRPGDPPPPPEASLPQNGKSSKLPMKTKLKAWIQPTCPNDVLAAAMIGVASAGFGEEGVSVFFENKEIVVVGKEWLSKLLVPMPQ